MLQLLAHSPLRYAPISLIGVVAHIGILPVFGEDVRLYRQMARLSLAGNDPFQHPEADFPPLKMFLFVQLERLDAWYPFLLCLELVFVTLMFWWVVRYYSADEPALILALALYFCPGGFFLNWFENFEDKIVYSTLVLVLFHILVHDQELARYSTAILLGLATGFLTAYAGIGLLQLAVIALAAVARQPRSRGVAKRIALSLALCMVFALLTHLWSYPEWLQAYQKRGARYGLITDHVSLCRIAQLAGLYTPRLQVAMTLLLVAVAGWKALAGSGALPGLAIVTFAIISLRPENSYDAVLAGLLPMVLLFLNNRAIVLAIVLMLAAVGYRIGFNDLPDPLKLSLMWLPALAALGWLIVRDLPHNLGVSSRWIARSVQQRPRLNSPRMPAS